MTVDEIRKTFLAFFEKRGHKIIPSASLVPENDSSVLFTTAGMQPLVPYLLGEPHPSKSRRLANIQKCVRTGDIDEVGDNTHLTFFEMMGNWSLGDYFKDEAIRWSYELLTSKNEGFGLDPKRLHVSVFEGDANAPKDEESAKIWESVGIPRSRIYFLSAEKNWWEAGPNGPCGPDTEMYYDLTEDGLGDLTHEQFLEADSKQQVVEIWNNVFMEYLKKDGRIVGKLPSRNVDTGSGLERVAAVLQKKRSVFETDAFAAILAKIRNQSAFFEERPARIVADHIRTAVFMLGDGIRPSNAERGYILRRLLRRAVRYTDVLKMYENSLILLVEPIAEMYGQVYGNLLKQRREIEEHIKNEEQKFRKTLVAGLNVLNRKIEAQTIRKGQPYKLEHMQLIQGPNNIQMWDSAPPQGLVTGKWLSDFYQTFGFPFDLAIEELKNRGYHFSNQELQKLKNEFNGATKVHQEISRVGAEKKFKGGLADTSDMSVKYHTATHLLHQALRDVLGNEVRQKGSNITPERLRFDFSFGRKMTDEEKKHVEEIVNRKIQENLPMQKKVLPLAEAEKTGALHFFGEKYADEVSIYFTGDSLETAYSKEFCGGPHAGNTGGLGLFRIQKEEAVSAGVRRIKAVLVPE